MPLPDLPKPLLDALPLLLRSEGLPHNERALAAGLRSLSQAYNEGAFPIRWTPEMEAARLAFFLPRDLRKVQAALRDLPWPACDHPLRLLDLGAGIGASALGAILHLRQAGHQGPIELLLVEPDGRALGRARRLMETLVEPAQLGPLQLQTLCANLALPPQEAPFDLVLLSSVLVEVGHEQAEEQRGRELLGLLLLIARRHLGPEGLLLLIEPALKTSARRLQSLRQRLLERLPESGLHVAAPCPHDGPCPLLARAEDWCHEDLSVDLPEELRPLARAAGLRWQGLTYARLALSRKPLPRPPLRVVAPPHARKGTHQHSLCAVGRPGLWVVERMDRHQSEANAAWEGLERGDGLRLPADLPERERPRLGPDDLVEPWPLPRP